MRVVTARRHLSHLPKRPAPRPHQRALGLLLALLALLGQMSAGVAMPMPELDTPAAGWTFPICHTAEPGDADPGDAIPSGVNPSDAKPSDAKPIDATPAPAAPAPHHHHGIDCALCPLCAALAAIALLPAPGPAALPGPAVLATRRAAIPPARAPPVAVIAAATFPTGPPSLS